MKKAVCVLTAIALCFIGIAGLAEKIAFEEVYKESSNTLTVQACTVTYESVVTGEILLQGVFQLKNETESIQRIDRVCLTVGTEGSIEETIGMSWGEHITYLYTGHRAEEIDFFYAWEQMLVDMTLHNKSIMPGETVTANFAVLLEKKRDTKNLQVLLQDLCIPLDE